MVVASARGERGNVPRIYLRRSTRAMIGYLVGLAAIVYLMSTDIGMGIVVTLAVLSVVSCALGLGQ